MMNMKGYKLILALTVQLFVGVTGAWGQGNQLYYNKVDTMELQNRFNLKTDAVGWLTLTPNLGLEFSLGNKNWNQWTVGVYGRANWDVNTRTTFLELVPKYVSIGTLKCLNGLTTLAYMEGLTLLTLSSAT